MNRLLLGALGALAMVAVGLFWWQGRAEVERGAPPPSPAPLAQIAETDIPTADVGDMEGPALPHATEVTREQQRFNRYDRDRDNRISRTEMLATRTDAFRKLDKDHNNLLTFEEWAVATADRFDGADANHDNSLSREEFAATKPKKKAKPACDCKRAERN